ncbi:hypothetical protein [Dietzia cinnamea]|uniref:hypothetical protein n=1 Tax=Dietzia cinnamea TaxID=321318 RepID=UPI0021A6E715|nr:hypothetical protein [Dietzia cinnamea]MCT2120982.1 hypothetical protein [Dietzia cinnamea]MCT2144712.1 hypothetical protein [Dietzia cinnamea]MCT2304686.1 hypothetical protein [Dietzia cinnamea]
MSSTAGFRRVSVRPAVTDAAVGVVVSGVLLAGVARPGFPLLRDWVATPTPPLSDAALGLGESAARAVPQDVAVAWATRALDAVGLPMWPLTGLLTAVFCVWLAVAAGALVRRVLPGESATGVWARLAAVVGAVWNPFVVERLLQGHWSLLAGAAAVVSMPVLLARGRPRGAAACAALAAAGLTPTGWVLAVVAAVVALACGGGGARRTRAVVALAATAVMTALPWALATALTAAGDWAGFGPGAGSGGAAGGGADAAAGVAAFAARAEPGIGTLGSVVALGGIWNSQAVPPSRATWWAAAALLALLLVWALAARGLWRARRDPVVRATVPVALAAWLLVAAAATGPGLAAMEALVTAVPGAGLLRDAQKFVALALPATVLALAFAARALATRALAARAVAAPAPATRGLPPRVRPIAAGVLVTAVAVASVPDAPRALWQQLRPVTYGPGWEQVAGIVDGRPGDLLVLPAGSFRSTPLWADGRPVLDPAPRLLDTRVLAPGDLVVAVAGAGAGAGDATAVPGEGDRARRATDALLRGADPRELAGLGVRWVLDERTSAGPRGAAEETLTATTTRFADPELTLHELAPPDGPGDADSRWSAVTPPGAPAWARAAVLAAHALWLLTLAGAAVASGRPGRRSRR